MIGVIDRFEEDIAVIILDDGKIMNLQKSMLPGEAKEGDVVVLEVSVKIDVDETKKRKEKADKYLELWED